MRTRRWGTAPWHERGSGTVLAIGLVGVLASLLVAGLLVAAVAMTGQRARTAADLAALAAAGHALTGGSETSACSAGSEVAAANGTVLVECRLLVGPGTGLPRAEVEVRARVADTRWQATARSAAGGVPAVLDR